MFFRRRPKDLSATESARAPRIIPSLPAAASVIGPNTRFRGEVRGRGPLVIRGQMKGTVAIEDRLTLESGGLLEADARATDLVVAGSVQGSLQAQSLLSVRSTGRVEGEIQARRMRVEAGALLRGTVSRGASER